MMSVIGDDDDVYSYNDESLSLSKSQNFLRKCNPANRSYKYFMLLLLCFVQSSSTYCNNLPVGLQHSIIQVMRIDNTLFGVLYSAEMYPNIFMPLIGGVLVDRVLGMKLGFLLVVVVA